MAGPRQTSVLVIGAGQAGLAAAYYLRRAGLEAGDGYVLLDGAPRPGAAWQHAWPSLRLFSPSEFSSLPGWQMPTWQDGFPPAGHVVDYLRRYEERYELPVHRPVTVTAVHEGATGEPRFCLDTTAGTWKAESVISATGTWGRPFWPSYPGQREFTGRQLHTVDYRGPDELAGQHVVVVGGGNSAAQLLAEVSTVTTVTWVAPRAPRFLPDDVDGRVLFGVATERAARLARGERDDGGVGGLGDVVMVPSMLDARRRGVLHAEPPFASVTRTGVRWADGRTQHADVLLWCTGFRPGLTHLAPLRLRREHGRPVTDGTRVPDRPGLYLLGYGDWTGPASATLIGVGQTARAAVEELTRAS